MTQVQSILPRAAHALLQQDPRAVLIDVRSTMEYTYVGHPIGAIAIPWKEPPAWEIDPEFVERVRVRVPDPSTPLLMLCRSGQRSLAAGQALVNAGYTQVYNVEEGFEGPLDADRHRGNLGGWRFHGLPWEQS